MQEFLQTLAADGPVAALEPDRKSFTLAEVALALGVKKASIAPLVTRHGLAAEGKGKARRFPRATVEALLAHRARGLGHGTAGYYARELKAFTRWLARRRRIAEDPLADLQGAAPTRATIDTTGGRPRRPNCVASSPRLKSARGFSAG